ncbi:hypothetical protein HK096_000279, partial [Nowakowskiella sp. JEL0078]
MELLEKYTDSTRNIYRSVSSDDEMNYLSEDLETDSSDSLTSRRTQISSVVLEIGHHIHKSAEIKVMLDISIFFSILLIVGFEDFKQYYGLANSDLYPKFYSLDPSCIVYA